MAFDLDAFIKDFQPTPEEEATLRATFDKPERRAVLEKNQLRQADYSKNQNDLKKAQDALSAAQENVNVEMAAWAKLTADEKVANSALQDRLEKAEQKALQLTHRVTKIATEAGIDPTKALEGVEQAVPPKKDDPPPVDTSRFVDRDNFAYMSDFLFTLATDLPMIAAEHKALTGEDLDTRALRAELTERAKQKGGNLDPRAAWEQKFGIAAIRETKANEAQLARDKANEERGYQRARTEQALPIAPSTGIHSPVLRGIDGKARESVLKRESPETGVRSAAAALATGKYRQQPAGATQ